MCGDTPAHSAAHGAVLGSIPPSCSRVHNTISGADIGYAVPDHFQGVFCASAERTGQLRSLPTRATCCTHCSDIAACVVPDLRRILSAPSLPRTDSDALAFSGRIAPHPRCDAMRGTDTASRRL
eukprot:3212601-Rhodomonas_salina.3